MRKGVGLGIEFIEWDADKWVYQKALKSFGGYKQLPPNGHKRSMYRDTLRWRAVEWRFYDFGADGKTTVDFYYYVNSDRLQRPSDCFIGNSC